MNIDNQITIKDIENDAETIGRAGESQEHYEKKKQVAKNYLESGWCVAVEHAIMGSYVVDVLVKKNNKTKIIEIGETDKDKVLALESIFDKVENVSYKVGDKEVSGYRSEQTTGEEQVYLYGYPILGDELGYKLIKKPPIYFEKEYTSKLWILQERKIPQYEKDSVAVASITLDKTQFNPEDVKTTDDLDKIVERHVVP